jgi:hypothetical protein
LTTDGGGYRLGVGVVSRLDAFQRRRSWVGFPLAVIYKFGDDQGPYLAALITYYAFLSLFPLLLILTTVLGFVLHDHPQPQQQLINSALSEFPIIGDQLSNNARPLQGSGVGLAIGAGIVLCGSLGHSLALQQPATANRPRASRRGGMGLDRVGGACKAAGAGSLSRTGPGTHGRLAWRRPAMGTHSTWNCRLTRHSGHSSPTSCYQGSAWTRTGSGRPSPSCTNGSPPGRPSCSPAATCSRSRSTPGTESTDPVIPTPTRPS